MADNYCPNIKTAIDQAGLSQKEIAITLKVSAATVSDWVSGKKTPTIKNLLSLAEICGTTPGFILGRESFLSAYVKHRQGAMNISEFAQQIGLSEQIVRTAERLDCGRKSPSSCPNALSATDLRELADALNVSFEFIACLHDGIDPRCVQNIAIPDDWAFPAHDYAALKAADFHLFCADKETPTNTLEDKRIMNMLNGLTPENKRKFAEKLEVLLEFQEPTSDSHN